jgi:hypothetical protein
VFRYLYTSTSRAVVNPTDLAAILRVARSNNARRNVTGLLLASGQRFLQLLEGDEADVMATMALIRADRRHYAIAELASGPIDARSFATWAMGFRLVGDLGRGMTRVDAIPALVAAIDDPVIHAYFAGFAELNVAAA